MAATAEHRRMARALTMHLDALGTGMPTRDEIITWLMGLEDSGDALTQLIADLAATTSGDGASLIGIEDSGGLITATDVEGALAENRTAIDAAEADIAALEALPQLGVASLAWGFADLVALGAVTSGNLDFAAALPADAIAIGHVTDVTEAVDNAGASSTTTATVGIASGDQDAFDEAMDPQTVAKSSGTKGASISTYVGAVTPTIAFASDVNFDTFTTGAGVTQILYVVP